MRLGILLFLIAVAIMIFQQKGLEVMLIIFGLVVLLALTVALIIYSWRYVREKEEIKEEENL